MAEVTRSIGAGTTLALLYGFFTLAAGARAGVQLATKPDEALFAYLLSAVAAVVYGTGAVLLALTDHGRCRRAALRLCWIEISGVLVIGTLSLAVPAWFPDATVWSGYGAGYGWVPAALPILALLWLHRSRQRSSGQRSSGEGSSGEGSGEYLVDRGVEELEPGVEQPLGQHVQRAQQVVGE